MASSCLVFGLANRGKVNLDATQTKIVHEFFHGDGIDMGNFFS